jgi:hypothetical protein
MNTYVDIYIYVTRSSDNLKDLGTYIYEYEYVNIYIYTYI